jgi:hypothetical protein
MTRSRKVGGVMTPGQLWTALEDRYPKREYALLAQVRNTTGFARRERTADAIALSLWPSRGLLLHGFEIKAYRGDWKRELGNPEKAEEIARFCDYWWLVVTDARIAPLDEVPPNWGVLAPNEDATVLVVVREAARLEPQPWSRGFMASVLRNVSDCMTANAAVNQKIEDARKSGITEGERRVADVKELERLRKLEQDVTDFEKASGLFIANLYHWQAVEPKKLGEALRTLVSGGDALEHRLASLDRLAQAAERMSADVRSHRELIAGVAASVAKKDNHDQAVLA